MWTLITLAVIHGVLFLAALPSIVRSGASHRQKRLQAAFSLLPIVGPILTYGIYYSDRHQLPSGDPSRTIFSSVEESRYVGAGHDRP